MADDGNKKAIQKKQPSKKKKKQKKQTKHSGHFCYVCGEHKAHEKFSGKGHANHICKACQSLPQADRNEIMATRKAENMAFRYLNETEIKWLRKRMNDPRPEVREAAREAHNFKFPNYNRNITKKGLTARSLEFFINGEVYDMYGDEIKVHMRFFVDGKGYFRRIDYDAPTEEQETLINVEQRTTQKFLKAVVQQLNAPFWSEDLSDSDGEDFDPYIDVLPEFRTDYEDYEDEENFNWALFVDDDDVECDEQADNAADNREPIWSLRLVLNKGGEKTQTFYNQMHQEPQELFWELMDWFEPDDEFDDELEEGDNE